MRKEMIDMPKYNTIGVQTAHGVMYVVWRTGDGAYATMLHNGGRLVRAWHGMDEAYDFIKRLLANEDINHPHLGPVVWVVGSLAVNGAFIKVAERYEDYGYSICVQPAPTPHEQYNAAMNYDNR